MWHEVCWRSHSWICVRTKGPSKPFRSSRRGKCAFKPVDGSIRGCILASVITTPRATIPRELVPRSSLDRLRQPHC